MKYLFALITLHLLAVAAGAQSYDSAAAKRLLWRYYIQYPYMDTSRPQQTTYEKGDSVWLDSFDTSKVKVYRSTLYLAGFTKGYGANETFPRYSTLLMSKYAMDTIGAWHLVSDTAKGHWNPVSAMYLYEV